jgi:hypothetical protein
MKFRGLDVAHPTNALEEGVLPHVKNLRAYTEGLVETRPGLSQQSSGHADGHSIFRFDDPVAGDYNYFCGIGTRVKFGKAALALTAPTGFSGDPLTSFVARPQRFGNPVIYIADRNLYQRFRVDGSAWNWGFARINSEPQVTPSPPDRVSITTTSTTTPTATPENGVVWNISPAGPVVSRTDRVNTTISQILYDVGSSGLCNVVPAVVTGTEFQPGMYLGINEGGGTFEFAWVLSVFPAIKTTTIKAILYDTGTTGFATLLLNEISPGLMPNTLIRLDSEYVRVLAVIDGPFSAPSVRVFTTVNHTAGQTVTGFRNLRMFAQNSHANGENLRSYGYTFPTGAAGTWTLAHNLALDLSFFPSAQRPITNDDYVSLGIFCSDLASLVEGRVMICLDPQVTTAYTAADYTREFFYYPFRPSDLQAQATVASLTQVANSPTVIQRGLINEYNAAGYVPSRQFINPLTKQLVSAQELMDLRDQISALSQLTTDRGRLLRQIDEQLTSGGLTGGLTTTAAGPVVQEEFTLTTGAGRWFELRVKVGQLLRTGNDKTRTWKDVTSFAVAFTTSANITVGFSLAVTSGGDGLETLGDDSGNGRGIYYRVVPRNSLTGEQGPPSPASRTPVYGRRFQNLVSVPQHPDPQIDQLDFYRYGGTLFQWTYFGSAPNTTNPVVGIDELPDAAIANKPLLDFGKLAPFPIADTPKRGTCDVVGVEVVRKTGDLFDVRWAPGTLITIFGNTFPLYSEPASTSRLTIALSALNYTDVAWEIQSPIIQGAKLPVVFGPFGAGSTGLYFFALGDTTNPGIVYWTNSNDPNSASDGNYLEVTDANDPLIGGCIYDGRVYLWSARKMFYLVFNFNPAPGELIFSAQEVANGRGAWTYTAICVDIMLYFVGKDGIYESEGGQPRSITNERLYPLFPHDGQPGSDITVAGVTIKAPDYSKPLSMKLSSDGEFVRFVYQAVDNSWNMLLFEKAARRWFYDAYGDGGLRVIYADSGKQEYGLVGLTGSGSFVRSSGALDVADTIVAELLLPAVDGGDPRAIKNWGDYTLDIDSDGAITSITPYFDNYTLAEPAQTNTNANRALTIYDLDNGDGVLAINMGLKVVHPGTTGARLRLWEVQPSWVRKMEDVKRRATDWENFAESGNVFLQGLLIEADTGGVDKTIQVDTDMGIVATLTLNHPRQSTKPYVIDPPVDVHQVRLLGTDDDSWRIYRVEWISEPTPESVTIWQSPPVSHGIPGWLFVREIWLTVASTDTVTVVVNIDGVDQPPVTTPTTGGVMTTRYLSFYPVKGKLFSYRLTSPAPFQLYETESWVLVGAWSRGQEMLLGTQPFGMKSSLGRESAAMI